MPSVESELIGKNVTIRKGKRQKAKKKWLLQFQ